MGESEEELKSLLMKVKEESENAGLKLNNSKKQRSWHPVLSLHGKQMETVTNFLCLGFKVQQIVTEAMNLKMLAPWKKSYDLSRQHIKKQRHYFANEGPSSQSYGFSSSHVWRESWTIKKVEYQRMDAFDCGVGEHSWESLGLQGYQTSQS